MKSCGDMAPLLVDHLYGELDESRRAELDGHLQGCPRCQAELESFQRVRAAARDIPRRDPPPAISAQLLRQASEARQGHAFGWLGVAWRALFLHPAVLAAASMVLIATVAGYLTFQGKVEVGPRPAPPQAAVPEAPRGEAGASVFEESTVEIRPIPVTSIPDKEAKQAEERGNDRLGNVRGGATAKKVKPPARSAPKVASGGDGEPLLDLFNAKGQAVQAPSLPAVSSNAPPPPAATKDAASVADLFDSARERAKNGDCAEALALRRVIAERDPGFYKSRVLPDAILNECVNRERERRAPAKAPAQHIDAEDAFEQNAN